MLIKIQMNNYVFCNIIYMWFTGGRSDVSLSDCQRVVHTGKLYDVTSKVHIRTGHGGRDKVLAAVKWEYYVVTRGYVETFCTSYPTCQKAAPNTVNTPIKPIVETEFPNRIQIDLIDMRQSTDCDYNYICHVMDHYTKFHIIYPLKKTKECPGSSIPLGWTCFGVHGHSADLPFGQWSRIC